MSDRYLTTNIMSNFLILIVPPLPGCVAYIVAEEMITDVGPLSLFLTVLIGVGALLVFFPLTLRITDLIRRRTK